MLPVVSRVSSPLVCAIVYCVSSVFVQLSLARQRLSLRRVSRPIGLFVTLLVCGCTSTNLPDEVRRNDVKGTLLYVEPFPFQSRYTQELAEVYMQAAWVRESASGDSLAVLFAFDVTGGRDVASILVGDMTYTFTVDPDSYEASESEVSEADRLSGVSTIVIPATQRVRAAEYWLVTRVSFP